VALERPWYRANDTVERNEAARRGYESVLIVTLRRPDSPQYDQFARRVRQRALREYGYDVYGEEVRCYSVYLLCKMADHGVVWPVTYTLNCSYGSL